MSDSSRTSALVCGFDGLVEQLRRDGAVFGVEPDRQELWIGPEPEHGLRVRWVPGAERVELVMPVGLAVPEDRLAEVALEVHAINRELALPGFELDASTGELRFRVVHLADQNQIPVWLLRDLVTTVLGTVRSRAVRLVTVAIVGEPEPVQAGEEAPWWAESGDPQP